MRVKPIKKGIMAILALFVFFSFTTFVFSQDKQEDGNKELREEILAVYQAEGEQGLLDFVKKKKDKISNKFIVDFAEAGMRQRNEEWLKTCEIMAKEKKDEKTLGDVLFKIGKFFVLISNKRKAANFFNRALLIYLKLKDQVGQGNVYFGRGSIHLLAGDKMNAMAMFDKAHTLFQKSKDYIGQGNVYWRKGDIYFLSGDHSNALKFYDKALTLFEKGGFYLGSGNVYLSKGNIFLRTGDNARVFEMYDKALLFYKKAGDNPSIGYIFQSKGDYYYYAGDNKKALEMYNKSLVFFEKTKNPIDKGNVFLRKGIIYSIIGKNVKALNALSEAFLIFEKIGYLTGQGSVCQRKGDIYFYKGDNLKAIDMYDKALKFFETSEDLTGIGNVLLRKGDIYSRTGNNSRAKEMYDKAINFYREIGEPRAQGIIYQKLGDIYFDTGENIKAHEMYDKAMVVFEKAGILLGQGNVYLRKGYFYFKTGNNAKALEMYGRSINIFEKVGEPRGKGNVFQRMGDIYFRTGRIFSSFEMYDKALAFYRMAEDIESESYALYEKAKILSKMGKKEEALNLFEKGIVNLEKVRTQTSFSEMKSTFMVKVYNQYEETALFMLGKKYYEKGFKYAESMRTRVFLDRMAEGLVRLDKGLPPGLKQKRDDLVAKLSSINKQIYETAGGKDEKKLQELKEQHRKTENEFDDLLIKIRLENPLYASVRYPEPITVPELQKEVLKKGELLVRYFISPEKLYVFLVSQDSFKIFPLKIKEKEVNSIIETYLCALKENNASHLKRYGKKLYKMLFKILEAELKKAGEIIIIPDGQLATIPFESFIIDREESGRPVFLLEKYRIKYIQSASILSVLRKHYQREGETMSFIGFGDPVYDYENFKQGKPEQGSMKILAIEDTEITEDGQITNHQSPLTGSHGDEIKEIHRSRYARAGGILNRLQASGHEVKSIATLFAKKNQKSLVYPREQASEDNAKAQIMKDFDFIHFACHGLLDGDFQSLVLSQIPGAKEDGYFTLNEIMNCDYNAKLVVLSACRTGSGKLERVEGVTGLTQAVMYAGTPAVVASLWDVDDIATKELMVNFYKNILEKDLDKAEALRQAKLELIKNKKYRFPLFWSAFVMYGE